MSETIKLVVFRIDSLRCALPLAAVDRIVRAVEVTALPGAPHTVNGMIDVEGQILPVLSLRRRFGLPERTIDVSDHYVIANTALRKVILVVDEAEGLIECDFTAMTRPSDITEGLDQFQCVVKYDDGLVLLIHNLETFLSQLEQRALSDVMGEEALNDK